jgi:hypothetical protein
MRRIAAFSVVMQSHFVLLFFRFPLDAMDFLRKFTIFYILTRYEKNVKLCADQPRSEKAYKL